MSRFAAITFSQNLKMSIFTSTGTGDYYKLVIIKHIYVLNIMYICINYFPCIIFTGKRFPAGKIDSLFANIRKVKLTKELTGKLCLAISGFAMYTGAFMIRSYSNNLEEIRYEQQQKIDSILKLKHLYSVKLQQIEPKPKQSDTEI